MSTINEATPSSDWLGAVAAEAALFGPSSSAERAADILRKQITEGRLKPGSRVPEKELAAAAKVSRNTLREAFRLLSHEGLLVYEMHRGVFVPEPTEADVVDLYRLRRLLECDVLEGFVGTETGIPAARLEPLRLAIEHAEAAARAGDWAQVGTGNMRFHEHLVGLADSARINAIIARLVAELRLIFHIIALPQELHEPYIARNRQLYEMLVAGRYGAAADELNQYLLDSEERILAAFRAIT
ncbi:GntR family transcriptional regulator [Kribbella deserti]|uniref:GntR family transcriptional regulator n=1 Tax=Kribbella deserti TaxID=1926257 RepID=A0ABV6QR05_9ACTN